MQPEAKLELKHEAETYGERLIDEVDAVREWLRKMPLRYQQWPTDPAYRCFSAEASTEPVGGIVDASYVHCAV